MNSKIALIILIIIFFLVNILLLFLYPDKKGLQGITGDRGIQGYGLSVSQSFDQVLEINDSIQIENLNSNLFLVNITESNGIVTLFDNKTWEKGRIIIFQNWGEEFSLVSFNNQFLDISGNPFQVILKKNSSIHITNYSNKSDNPKILSFYFSDIMVIN